MAELVKVNIVGDAKSLQGAVGEATGSIKGMGGGLSSMLSPAMLGVAGAAVAATVAIAKMTMAAAADRDEQVKLETALKAAGVDTGDWSAQVDEAISKGQSLAFTDTAIREALVPLAQATGDMTEANKLLATAEDVSRLTGDDLTTVSEALAKAHGGN